MNILIPNQWLGEYLKTTANPEQIMEQLSLCGPSVERIYGKEASEKVFDIEITTNRVDCMSIKGLAREAAVILKEIDPETKFINHQEQIATIQAAAQTQISSLSHLTPLPKITLQTPEFCRKIICTVLEVDASPITPDWMKNRLIQIGVSSHQAIIDITNYISHELGHPCHAFDYDKIMNLGGEIIIKTATAGQKFTTLDNNEYITVGGEIIFTNPSGEIIDLPAVKGTANSAIDDQTTKVLFWLENLNPEKVRFASMSHAIRTTAAVLNEKDVDPQLAPEVFYRGIQLYQELCHAQIISEIYEYNPPINSPQTISTTFHKINQYLGIELSPGKIAQILTDLGLKVEIFDQHIKTIAPSFRGDLNLDVDIIEEIARIYGYHNLASTLGFKTTHIPAQKENNFTNERALQNFLANNGYHEVYQYSTVSAEIAQQSGVEPSLHLALKNPLTNDRVYLRQSLLPSLHETFLQNTLQYQNGQLPIINIFEIAKVFIPQPDLNQVEEMKLSLISNQNYPQVRADLENLLKIIHLDDIKIKELNNEANLAHLKLNGQTQIGEIITNQNISLGYITVFNTQENPLIGIELKVNALNSQSKKYPKYQPKSPYQMISEELTFTINIPKEEIKLGSIIDQIRGIDHKIYSVKYRSQYQQNYTFTLTYHDENSQLAAAEISALRQNIVDTLEKDTRIKLIGNLKK